MHDLVAGGGLSPGDTWLPSRPDFLVPVTPLSVLFRAKFRDHLKKTALCPLVDAHIGHKDWVVHGKPVGRGAEAFRYLAPYIFRVAIRNKHILTREDGHVTFQYKDSATHQTPSATVPAQEFMRRFLQHVLPERFINVRSYGFLSPGHRQLLTKVSQLCGASTVATTTTRQHPAVKESPNTRDAPRCPTCANILLLVETLRPNTRSPP